MRSHQDRLEDETVVATTQRRMSEGLLPISDQYQLVPTVAQQPAHGTSLAETSILPLTPGASSHTSHDTTSSRRYEQGQRQQQPPRGLDELLSPTWPEARHSTTTAVADLIQQPVPPSVYPSSNLLVSPSLGCDVDPSWFLREDFDLGAIDTSISAAISEWSFPPANLNLGDTGANRPHSIETTSQISNATRGGNLQQQQPWDTLVTGGSMQPTLGSEVARDPNHVDDRYRANLLKHIQPQYFEPFLPSADFMVNNPHTYHLFLREICTGCNMLSYSLHGRISAYDCTSRDFILSSPSYTPPLSAHSQRIHFSCSLSVHWGVYSLGAPRL